MKIVKELHLLVALPGSGKTTFANTYLDLNGRHRFDSKFKHGDVIDFDAIYKKAGFNEKLQINRDKIEKMKLKTITRPYVILDGLFISQEEYEWVLNLFINGEQYKNVTFEKIVVDYWPEDKETCIWNDRGRRDYTSELSIDLIELDRPDVKAIENKFGIKTKLEIHHIVRKPAYLVMAGENGFRDLKDNRYLVSCSWSLGGVGRSWRDDSTYPISGEEPLEFDEFDALLEKICPNITFLQYKKLYKASVTMDDRDAGDYYSNCREAFWLCDLEKLYNMLVDMGIYSVPEA